MRFEIDTASKFNDAIPDGTFEFEIHKMITKTVSGKQAIEMNLDYRNDDGLDLNGRQLLWPNQLEELFKVLDIKKDPASGKYVGDTDMQEGKKFIATVSRKADKKDPSKIYQTMSGFKKSEKEADVPFG